MFAPTDEQVAFYDALKARDGRPISLQAYAGSGKTASIVWAIKELLKVFPGLKITLIYYNRAAFLDAKARLADCPSVQVVTNHTKAFGTVGKFYENSYRLLGSQQHHPKLFRVQDIADLFGIEDISVGEGTSAKVITGRQQASLALSTINKYITTADWRMSGYHVPYRPQLDEYMQELRPVIAKWADQIWLDKCDTSRGVLPITHDEYLKMWAEGKRSWYFGQEIIIVDEQQDTNPVMRKVLIKHNRVQLVGVGDRYQKVYGYRGAEVLSDYFNDPTELYLTRTFRFGGELVEEANKWLAYMGAAHPLVGRDDLSSTVTDEDVEEPGLIIGRTNSANLGALVNEAESGRKYAIGGGAKGILALAEDIARLHAGEPAEDSELAGFSDWPEFVAFVKDDPSGANYKTVVSLVDEHGPQVILDIATNAVALDEAEVIAATPHSLKGLEADRVRIVGTWQPTDKDGEPAEPTDEESSVGYVAISRAKRILARGDLGYIDELSLGFPGDDDEDDEDSE